MKRSSGLSKEEILEIFKQNFQYPVVKTILGDAVKMPSRDAFIFCDVTGSGYLDSPIYQYTPKGLLKLFYNAFDYNFVSGIFEKTSLRNTPYLISKGKPYVFGTEYKYIVPIEFQSEIELQDYLIDHIDKLDTPTDYIVMRIEASKKGHGLESFLEYLAGEYFKKKGFIVENQIPLAHAIGSPDFGGYDLKPIFQATQNHLPSGFHIIELAMLRLNASNGKYSAAEEYPNNLIVGEAKTSTTEMDGQLRKYLDTGLFDWGFEMHPSKENATFSDRGLLTIDSNYRIRFVNKTTSYHYSPGTHQLSQKLYIQWLVEYMKFYLLANLTNDELARFYISQKNEPISTQEKLVEFVRNLTANQIINYIESL